MLNRNPPTALEEAELVENDEYNPEEGLSDDFEMGTDDDDTFQEDEKLDLDMKDLSPKYFDFFGRKELIKPLNKCAIFITNSKDKKNVSGSSVYFISELGTIRCSCSHNLNRSPTTFIRPYKIRYLMDSKDIIRDIEPAVGSSPFEAAAKNLLELNCIYRYNAGHYGNPITEIITESQLNNPTFIPATWINTEDIGVLWSKVIKEIREAYKYAVTHLENGYFPKCERTIDKCQSASSLAFKIK